jgi:hypothetical protein
MRRPLGRLRLGKSELAAASIAGAIVVATGLMLAAFGAANQHGLSEQYTAAAAPSAEDEEHAGDLNNNCNWAEYDGVSCKESWAKAMAGGETGPWNGEDDWMESECRISRQCYDQYNSGSD